MSRLCSVVLGSTTLSAHKMDGQEPSSTEGSVSRGGISNTRPSYFTQLLSLAIVAALFGATACAHHPSRKQSQTDDEDEGEEALTDGEFYEGPKLTHPTKPTAYATRILLTTSNLPPASDLAKCADEMKAVAKAATNNDLLVQSQMSLMNAVSASPTLYHYCFYTMMMELDQKLEEGGPIMTDLADQFFAGFRALWILSRTLDAYTGSGLYFEYLRKRYVQISKDYFGRNLEQYRYPLTNDLGGEMVAPGGGWGNKPAGPAPID